MKKQKMMFLGLIGMALALIATPLFAIEQEQVLDRAELSQMLQAEVEGKIDELINNNTWLNDGVFSYLKDSNLWYFDNFSARELNSDNNYNVGTISDVQDLAFSLKSGDLPLSQVKETNKQFDVMSFFLDDKEMLNKLLEAGFNPRITLERRNGQNRNIFSQCVLVEHCDMDNLAKYVPSKYVSEELYNALSFLIDNDDSYYSREVVNADLEKYQKQLSQAREALKLLQEMNTEDAENMEGVIKGLEEAIQYCQNVLADFDKIDQYYKKHTANYLNLANEVLSGNIYGLEAAYKSISNKDKVSESVEALKHLKIYVD